MHNHYAPPQAYAADVSAPSHVGSQNASLERRFVGAMIDAVFLFALGTLVSMGSAAVLGVQRTPNWAFAAMFVPQGVLWYLVATRGQSIGKILMKTRIVRLDGSAPGFVHGVALRVFPFLALGVLVRFVPGDPKDFVHMLPSIASMIDVGFIFAAGWRCLHDRIAGTRVVDLRAIGSAYGRGPW